MEQRDERDEIQNTFVFDELITVCMPIFPSFFSHYHKAQATISPFMGFIFDL